MRTIKISIIIPVYNLEDYIADTLDSCLAQDMKCDEYEIICVDDGSSDKSCEIIREYQKKNNNILICQKENGGVSSARNAGLEHARGEYIWFVDGDDLIAPNCLIFLYETIKRNHGDLFWFKMKHFTGLPEYVEFNGAEIKVCDDPQAKYDFMTAKGGGGVCSVFYKRAFIQKNGVVFNEGIKYSEDVLFCFEAILKACICVKTDAVCYYYRQREGSAMHSNRTSAHIESMEKLAIAYDELLKKEKRQYEISIIKNKRDFAVKAMLFSIMQTGNITIAKEKVELLEALSFYPYPLKKELLVGNETWKQLIINIISFFFPIKVYYFFCVRMFSLKRT